MYNIHPDFMRYSRLKPTLNPVLLPAANLLIRFLLDQVTATDGLVETEHIIRGYKNGLINVSVISPGEDDGRDSAALPALVYFHGGGFALLPSTFHKQLAYEYALKTPCKVIYVDYRLLPKAAYPVGLGDCYSAYRWVHKNAKHLGIDKNRIAVGGDSAGGALAAGVCLLTRDRGKPVPCFQMLIYPVTDRRQSTRSMKKYRDTPMWNSKLNDKMWRMYLKNGLPDKIEYASPMEAASFKNMPPAYVEVAELDCLRDEGIAYAKALKEDGVSVSLRKTKGTIHGYDIVKESKIVKESVEKRIAKLKKAFGVQ